MSDSLPLFVYQHPSAGEQENQEIIDRLRALGLWQHIPKAHINSNVPACTLPFEVLSRIFVFLATLEPPLSPARTLARFSWFKATRVCRMWRSVALADGRLWGDIQFSLGRRWAAEMIVRSHAAPLHIRSRGEPGIEHAPELLAAHVGRIGTLDVNTAGMEALGGDCLASIMLLRAPLMETVRLVLESGFVLDLPGEMFYGHAPRLRNLSLCGAFLAWDARILDGASHMRVFVVDVIMRRRVASGRYTLQGEYSDDGWPEDQAELEPVADAEDAHVDGDDPLLDQYPPNPDNRIPKLARLLDILDGMPRLEELRLEGVIPIHDRMQPPGSPRTTSLSHLTRLTLSGPLLGCVQLINALDLPGLESFHLFCILPVQGRTSIAIAALLPFLTKHCSRSNEAWRPVHTLEIRSTASSELQIRAPAGDLCGKPQSDGLGNIQSDDDIFNIEFRLFEPSLHTQGRILETVLSALPVSNTLQRIFIHGLGRVSKNRWVRALGHCTELREIHVGKVTLQLLEALGSGLDNPSVFLPKLEFLELRGSRLNHRCPHGGPVLEVLFRVLEERKRRGVWLEVLDLRSAWHTKAQHGEIASKDLARVVHFNPTTKPQRARIRVAVPSDD